jgi:hypothetical protein
MYATTLNVDLTCMLEHLGLELYSRSQLERLNVCRARLREVRRTFPIRIASLTNSCAHFTSLLTHPHTTPRTEVEDTARWHICTTTV